MERERNKKRKFVFYGILAFVSYLIPVYIYIYIYIWFVNEQLIDFKQARADLFLYK